MSGPKIDLRELFKAAKSQVIAESSNRQNDEEVRRLYNRMTCIRFMRPLLNYASNFALMHDRPYDQRFIDLLLFHTDTLQAQGKRSFDPVNSSLNLGYCIVKELAAATPDVTPTMLQSVFRSSFPHFSNAIKSCLDAYNFQKAKPELIVAIFRDVYRSIIDSPARAEIVNLIDGDYPAIHDSKSSLICTEINMLFKLSVANDFAYSEYVRESKTKNEVVGLVLKDTVSTVDLWVKQISDDADRKVVLASDAGVKLVQNLLNVTSDIMFDELVHQIKSNKQSTMMHEKATSSKGDVGAIAAARKGFVQRVGIYAEKTESIAYSFNNYLNMIGSKLFQEVYESSGTIKSALNIQISSSSMPKLVKLISLAIDSSMLRLKDYLAELKHGMSSKSDEYEFAQARHYSSSGDLTVEIISDLDVSLRISKFYIQQLTSRFCLSEDLKERHWFSSEIFQSIYECVSSFQRESSGVDGLEERLLDLVEYIVLEVDEFVRSRQINWISSNGMYNPKLKQEIMAAVVCSATKAAVRNAAIYQKTYSIQPNQIKDVIRLTLDKTHDFFDKHKADILSGISNEGAIMVFQNLMSNISRYHSEAIYSAMANVAKQPDTIKTDFLYNYHVAESDISTLINGVLEHAPDVHDAINLMRMTHLVSAPPKKSDVAVKSEGETATVKNKSAPQLQDGIKVRSLR